MRLFIGSLLSDDEQNAIERLQHSLLASKLKNIRWSQKKKLHQTWLFLGEQDPSNFPALNDKIKTALCEFARISQPLSLLEQSYERVSLWPCTEKARVLVLESLLANSSLVNLAGIIKRHVAELLPDNSDFRDFKPHITLARATKSNSIVRDTGNEISDAHCVTDNETQKLLPLTVRFDWLHIVQSQNGDGQYKTLSSFSLTSPLD